MSKKGVLWEVDIYEGVLGMVHGACYRIKEINIPSIKISVNTADNSVHCFECSSNDGRYKQARNLGEVDVSDDLMKAAKAYLKAKNALNSEIPECLLKK